MARQLHVPRSSLYAQAIAEFLAAQGDETVTAKLDEAYSNTRAGLDPELQRAQAKLLKKSSW